jgi:hypothetical protein
MVPNLKREDIRMSLPDYLLEPDDDADQAGECTGDPYTCPCKACCDLWSDVEADMEYDEGKEAA